MKKSILLLLLLLACNYTKGQIINFPDANLKAKLLSATPTNGMAIDLNGIWIKIDSNSNNEIEVSEALNVKELRLTIYTAIYLPISNLTGLNHFTNLTSLVAGANITSLLPISNLTNLINLECTYSPLNSLVGIENLTNLKTLRIQENNLVTLAPISNLINLEQLSCSGNQLNSISSLQNLVNLNTLYCNNNQITSTFGIENLINLTSVSFSGNQLSSITSMENLINLIQLDLNYNNFTSFSTNNIPNLGSLSITNNNLTSLNISNLSNLVYLDCSFNLLTTVDISGTSVFKVWGTNNPNLQILILKNNVITQSHSFNRTSNIHNTSGDIPSIPPPLPPNFYFSGCPNIISICYDVGELPAVQDCIVFSSLPSSNITLTTNCITFTDKSTVNLKLNLQGYYDTSTNSMKPVKYNQGMSTSLTDVTDLNVQLYTTNGTVVSSTTAKLNTDGTATCLFPFAPSGQFYIGVKSNNTITIYSSTLQSVGTTPLTYDFTNSASKAFGNNLTQLSNGSYAMYSGDVNNDGFVDPSDYSDWETDANNFAFGFYATDLNGDGFVDPSDYSIWEENAGNFVSALYPFP